MSTALVRSRPTAILGLLLALLACTPQASPAAQAPAPRSALPAQAAPQAAPAPARPPAQPVEWLPIARVVDGDTIHVERAGKVEKLRLLSVDTEERLATGQGGGSKPGTVFGEECALWAQRFFGELAGEDGRTQVGLVFPGGPERRDVFGRLLCHVILRDGRNFNLLLVELGKSPYFTKYGRDELAHEAFAAAQARAQEQQLGIWDPATNVPRTPGETAAKRPYDRLLPWWDARGAAMAAFRERAARAGELVFEADDPSALARAARADKEVEVFGEIDRVFDEHGGEWTVLLRSGAKDGALRVRVPKDAVVGLEQLGLRSWRDEFRQNYLWYRGRVQQRDKGFHSTARDAAQWRQAGPEPALPAEQPAAKPVPEPAGAPR